MAILKFLDKFKNYMMIFVFFAASFTSVNVNAQENHSKKDNRIKYANFAQAEKFTADNVRKMVFSTSVRPNWIEESDRFWYSYKTTEGKKFYVVDAARKSKREMFDNEVMASKLTEYTKKPYNAKDLDMTALKFNENTNVINFKVDTLLFNFDINSNVLTFIDTVGKDPKRQSWKSFSPDSSHIVFARDHNLFIMKSNDPDSVETQLTTDGEMWYSFSASSGDTTKNERVRSNARWFRDSSKLSSQRRDRRKLGDLWVINSIANPRPTLQTYKYPLPGEENIDQHELIIFDVESKNRVEMDTDKWKDQAIERVYFGKSSDKIYFTRRNRLYTKVDLCVGDTETGEVKVLISEESEPYFDTRQVKFAEINDGNEIIWWNERDGWGHLYLFDGKTGVLKNQITNGAFRVANISKIDTVGRTLYIGVNGKEKGMDPYYNQYYKINFDGSGMERVTPENATHSMNMSESRKFFVDNYSTVNTVPKSVLRDNNGGLVMDLETTDMSLINEAGWKMPEMFKSKADDGVTDLYGVMWKPFDFDPKKKYPIVAYVYPGPQTESVPKGFTATNQNVSLAQMGFVVVAFGNRGGSPQRSKYYHTFGYGNARDYGLADKKAVLENLADRFDFINIDKVGIYGHSGGGFMSTAAMLVYPDFFKTAVSSSGNHDNNIYNIWWSELHFGVKEVRKKGKDGVEKVSFSAKVPTNIELAKNLKGNLLLTTGDIDNNVHPGNTIRMANALIKAKKKFDFFIFPGKRHGYGNYGGYFRRMTRNYFAEHLIGDNRINIEMFDKNPKKK